MDRAAGDYICPAENASEFATDRQFAWVGPDFCLSQYISAVSFLPCESVAHLSASVL